MWFAGGGVKGGRIVGQTDEFGLRALGEKYHMRDFHATVLHLLGYDHETDDGQMARVEARLRRKGGLPSGLIARGARPRV